MRLVTGDGVRDAFERLEAIGLLVHERVDTVDTGTLDERCNINQDQCAGVDDAFAHGHQGGATAERCSDQHRVRVAERLEHMLQIKCHHPMAIGAVRRPVRITVPAGVERSNAIAC